MTDSKRESILKSLNTALSTVITPITSDYLREDVEPEEVSSDGSVRLFDGFQGPPIEVVLSPVTYFWQHRAEIVVLVQNQDSSARVAKVDEILQAIQAAVDADKTLGGLCDYVETLAPEDDTEQVEGASAIKRAFVGVVLHYNSTSALG